MSTITKVALAGATGNLGPAILDQLLKADFKVTVLTRKGTNHDFPSSVTVQAVDYDSLDSLTNALTGQEAFVSTLAHTAISTQLLLIEAASKAGIQRFIPSEFGSNTQNSKARALPVFKDKATVQDALKKEAESSGMSYSLICTGPFLDWGLKVGFWMNLKGRTIDMFDGGERVFSATSLPSCGKAVVGVLKHPEQTKNRAVFVHDIATTMMTYSVLGEQVTEGKEGKWKETVVKTDDLVEQAWGELKKEKGDMMIMAFGFIKAAIWGDGYGSHFEKTDNELFGIEAMTEVDLRTMMEGMVE